MHRQIRHSQPQQNQQSIVITQLNDVKTDIQNLIATFSGGTEGGGNVHVVQALNGVVAQLDLLIDMFTP